MQKKGNANFIDQSLEKRFDEKRFHGKRIACVENEKEL